MKTYYVPIILLYLQGKWGLQRDFRDRGHGNYSGDDLQSKPWIILKNVSTNKSKIILH